MSRVSGMGSRVDVSRFRVASNPAQPMLEVSAQKSASALKR